MEMGFPSMAPKLFHFLLQVDCRIGSLESCRRCRRSSLSVDCRIGSLENNQSVVCVLLRVDCRIGSLEINAGMALAYLSVDCRIGSLETHKRDLCHGVAVDCRIEGRIGTPAGMQEGKMKKAPLAGAFLMACFLLWCVPFGRGFVGGEVYRRWVLTGRGGRSLRGLWRRG